jgi:hypothetical protein
MEDNICMGTEDQPIETPGGKSEQPPDDWAGSGVEYIGQNTEAEKEAEKHRHPSVSGFPENKPDDKPIADDYLE